MTTLIAATTDAVPAGPTRQFTIGQKTAATLSATLLAGVEEVDLTYSGDSGASFQTATDDAGNPLVLTATISQLKITGPGIYRVAKDATAGACAVNVVK